MDRIELAYQLGDIDADEYAALTGVDSTAGQAAFAHLLAAALQGSTPVRS